MNKMTSEIEIDLKERLTLAVVVRTEVRHIKAILDVINNFPETKVVYKKTSIGKLYIKKEPQPADPIMELNEEED